MISGSLKKLALLAGIPLALVAAFIAVCLFYFENQRQAFEKRAPFFQSSGGDVSQSSAAFDANVQEKFYRGMPEEDVIKNLLFLEFRVNREARSATYSLQVFPCINDWTISWTAASDGRLVTIKGLYGLTCP